MSQDDSLEYSGPNLEYTPPTGGRLENPNQVGALADFVNTTYASKDYIYSRLDALDAIIANTESDIETIMDSHAMPVRENDLALQEAHQAEWPLDQDPSEQVTYKYYKYLGLKNTASAQYIRKRYEEAVRDIGGTNAIDIAKIFELIKTESSLAREFLDTYLGDMDDTAEFRAAEILQDWAGSAISKTQDLQQILQENGPGSSLPEEEVQTISQEEARKAQAVFKVKLNGLNDELSRHFEIIKRNWSDYADVFFHQYLGPSISFRLNVNRTAYPINSVIGKEVYTAAGSMNESLSNLLTDYARRNNNFNSKVNEMITLINARDVYRNYITELSSQGTSITSESITKTAPLSDSPDIISSLNALIDQGQSSVENRFISYHDSLDGRENITAHPQYLLRSGGYIEGDILVKDLVKIDGVDLSAHRHSGMDGSKKIDATSIEYNTLVPSLVNKNSKPSKPTNLSLQSLNPRTLPSGQVIIDAIVTWESEDGNDVNYEVSVSKIT